ncbi:btk-binding protein-related [Anaeramoeba flamelloides]|uniref:Btk-binding protein-related n=1 Tax=Anaeramoeba flamelloides TaxID=1746091 RepID=A0ABQ8YA34_9EUKA|nr:btk-binding protein-related [Anaeramoeba flamelloides]
MSQEECKVFFGGCSNVPVLCGEQKKNFRGLMPCSQIQDHGLVRKVVCGEDFSKKGFLIWKGKNKLKLIFPHGKPIDYLLKNEQIKDVQSGYSTFLILRKSGKVFSLARKQNSYHCEIPLEDPEKSNYDQIRPVPFFNEEKNNRKVKSLAMVGWSNYFLCENGDLYGNGYNSGRLGDGTSNDHKNIPILIYKKVTRVFGGVQGYHFFFTTESNELFGCGSNKDDLLSLNLGDNILINTPRKGKLMAVAVETIMELAKKKTVFTEIPLLKDKNVIKLTGGNLFSLVLTSENELYGWGLQEMISLKYGSGHDEKYLSNLSTIEKSKMPRKITLPQIFQKSTIPLDFSCGPSTFFIFPNNKTNSLSIDFKNLFESKRYYDSKLIITNENENKQNKQIQIHKFIVEFRTGLKIEQINKLLNQNNINKNEIQTFLKWAYFDQKNNCVLLGKVLNALNMTYPPENKLKNDILKLYQDEDSKDFKILVKIDDEEEEEEEEQFEEIPVHKLILLTRSGLFREMFDNLTENEKEINQIKDYSGKSIESLEILIKYFYTNSIVLTADDDPQLIVEELEDSIEYYQLNKSSNLNLELKKIKKQFNLL